MSLEQGIAELKKPENQFQVINIPITINSMPYCIIGISDLNPETNLAPYQNMSYILVNASTNRALVIDPGIRGERGSFVRDSLGIEPAFVVLTHYHLDHWIGFEPYKEQKFYATQRCIDVLTGKENTTAIKIFDDGRLTFGHTRDTPRRAIEDAKRSLPLTDLLFRVYTEMPTEFPIQSYELPGQTLGTLYGVIEADREKIVFAGDLFIDINKEERKLVLEPHYSEEIDIKVMSNVILVLKAIMAQEYEIPEGYEEFPQIREKLSRLEAPDKLLLGHGSFEMNTANKAKIEEFIKGLEEIVRLHEQYVI